MSSERNAPEETVGDQPVIDDSVCGTGWADLALIAGGTGLWKVDTESNRFQVNSVAKQIMELDPDAEAFSVEDFLEQVHPDDKAGLRAHFATALDDQAEFEINFRLKPLGPERILKVKGRPGTGAYRLTMLGTVVDVTEINFSYEHAVRTLENMEEALTTFDRNWRYTYVNRAAERLLQRPREELVGQTLWESWPQIIGTYLDRSYKRAMHEMVAVVLELYFEPLHRWLSVRIIPWTEGVAVYFFDVGDRKRTEAEVIKVNDLNGRLRERIENSERLESLGRLTNGVAYEFDRIISVVNGLCDEVLPTIEDPEIKRMAEQVAEEGARGSRLAKRLISLGRRTELIERIQLGRLTVELQNLLQHLVGPGIDLSIEVGSEVTVRADRSQVEQVLVNLCANARDAMSGSGRLAISVSTAEAPTDVIEAERVGVISVSDSGTGVDEAIMQKIFDPFFTTKLKAGGTGLGLVTVSSIVRHFGGHVFVESQPGLGATFKVMLPLVE